MHLREDPDGRALLRGGERGALTGQAGSDHEDVVSGDPHAGPSRVRAGSAAGAEARRFYVRGRASGTLVDRGRGALQAERSGHQRRLALVDAREAVVVPERRRLDEARRQDRAHRVDRLLAADARVAVALWVVGAAVEALDDAELGVPDAVVRRQVGITAVVLRARRLDRQALAVDGAVEGEHVARDPVDVAEVVLGR